MKERYAIYGTGGFAREVLGPLRAATSVVSEAHGCPEIVFIDDDIEKQNTRVQDIDVVSYEWARENKFNICIAISDHIIRKNIAEICVNDNLSFFSVISDNLKSYQNVFIGPGSIICDNVLIATDVTIGSHFHANYYSYVAHDCVIGDFVTFAPRVCCNGSVRIGDGAYVGTGAFLKQGISIGDEAVIGMGAVVTKDVAPKTTVVGNPARPIPQR